MEDMEMDEDLLIRKNTNRNWPKYEHMGQHENQEFLYINRNN